MRPAYVHSARVTGDAAGPGAAVTLALCGVVVHPGTDCRWPHHTSSEPAGDGAHDVRVVFACDADDEERVRALVAGALASGQAEGPGGPAGWTLVEARPDSLLRGERALAQRLSGTPWWTSAVVYQVYPRSFADSGGDGVGDLRGIIDHLDHLEWLGVDVLWLSPVYRSPQHDAGYDISDYEDVDPVFGTLADLDELVAGLHARGIRLVMDLVVNHTSDEHPWFVASRSSPDGPERDRYWWRPARAGFTPGTPGAEPTNWESFFSGPAWEYDEASGRTGRCRTDARPGARPSTGRRSATARRTTSAGRGSTSSSPRCTVRSSPAAPTAC